MQLLLYQAKAEAVAVDAFFPRPHQSLPLPTKLQPKRCPPTINSPKEPDLGMRLGFHSWEGEF
eukprot:6460509-Amphidinium_carterae.1